MISMLNITKMTDRSVIAASPFGISLRGSGLGVSCALLPVVPAGMRSERPIQAPAVAAVKAQAQAYAFAAAANGAGAGTAEGALVANGQNEQQKTQQHGKWAFRGLEPWSDPA